MTTPAPAPKPIPAFYCVYLLRSTIKHTSLYIGSTPHPLRRLKQHNGVSKGGAVRTSRDTLRPWEMSAIITGFPSHISALQFEWAYQNPHLTLHIPSTSRLALATGKKKSGRPKRPRHTITSVISNLHLLLHVPSFARWPLELRFFSEDVWRRWCAYTKAGSGKDVRGNLRIVKDFASEGEEDPMTRQLSALQVDYAHMKDVVSKSKEIFDFENEGDCAVCGSRIEHHGGLTALCPGESCKAVSHVTCLSQKWLREADEEDAIVPDRGKCPTCGHESSWIEIMKETSLRERGQKEIEKILKEKRVKKVKEPKEKASKSKGKSAAGKTTVNGIADLAASQMDSDDSLSSDSELSDLDRMFESDEEESDREMASIQRQTTGSPDKNKAVPPVPRQLIVIEDSDFDESELLD